jgi:CDP-diacylglycerol--serine O-phosphatidyltransferase
MNTEPSKPPGSSKRGIYLLPNLLTTGALFAGFFAIVSANLMRFETAAIAIFVAMLLDGMDGRVARMTNTTSQFGKEYDSLADMVSFGLAPALIMFEWSLKHFTLGGWVWPKVGWLAAFLFTAGAALRLARFNARSGDLDRRYFQGLPSPAAAGVMVGMVWVGADLQVNGADLWWLALITTVTTGICMVSNMSYYSFKEIDVLERIPFIAMLAIVGVFILLAIDPPKVFFAIFLVYAASGPVTQLMRWRKRRSRQSPQADKRTQ